MLHPLEAADPLFTLQDYNDQCMEEQLAPGQYKEFRALKRQRVGHVLARSPSPSAYHLLQGKDEITWTKAFAGFDHSPRCVALLQKLQDKLSDNLKTQRVQLGAADDGRVHQEMVALLLRYRCIGVLHDNLHGSIPGAWATALPGFVECFASPFNHRFPDYFSMFQEDAVFGSRGNFFAWIHALDDVLPDGRYEINPPWTNDMFDRVAGIMCKTLLSRPDCEVQAIIIAPIWTDASWTSALTTLIENTPGYARFSRTGIIRRMRYEQDVSDQEFSIATRYFLFTRVEFPEGVLAMLGIH